LTIILIWAFLALGFYSASAYVMGSDNYRIQSDSLNMGGTDNNSSTSYHLLDTLGEAGTGGSSSDNYKMNAGYRQMDETYLALTLSGTVTMSPHIDGLHGGTANGSASWTVRADSPSGYYLSIKANTDPAMQSGPYSFDDYTPTAPGVPDYDWFIGSANSEFGFSPYNDVSQVQKYRSQAGVCGTGVQALDGQCWNGFTMSYEQIANRATRTPVDGETTKVNFRAEVNTTDGFQVAAPYSVSLQITAVEN